METYKIFLKKFMWILKTFSIKLKYDLDNKIKDEGGDVFVEALTSWAPKKAINSRHFLCIFNFKKMKILKSGIKGDLKNMTYGTYLFDR